MKHITLIDRYTCNIDPLISAASSVFSSGIGSAISAAATGAGAAMLGSSLAGGGGGGTPTQAPAAAPTAPPPTQDPIGTRSGSGQRSPTSPSFVGAAAVPQQQGYGGKTLLGQ